MSEVPCGSINVAYWVEGWFDPTRHWPLCESFDGIGISQFAGTAANASGLLTGSFQIPQAIPLVPSWSNSQRRWQLRLTPTSVAARSSLPRRAGGF